MPPRSNTAFPANLGLYLGRPALQVPKRGLLDALNIRIKEGRVSALNLGWDTFGRFNALTDPVTLIDNLFLRSGGQVLIFGTTRDLYQFKESDESVDFLTPRHETGTLTATRGSAVLTGADGPAWDTNLKVGDRIAIGSTGFTKPDGGNLLIFSQEMDNTDWLDKSGITITANDTVAPDGTTTAEKILETATTSLHRIAQRPDLADSEVYFASVHAKPINGRNFIRLIATNNDAISHSVYFNISSGTSGFTAGSPSNITITDAGNSFFRCSFSFPSETGATQSTFDIRLASADGTDNYLGDITKGIHAWGAQLHLPKPVSRLYPYHITTMKWYEILTVDSATQVTLTNRYREPSTGAGTAYTARQIYTGDIFDYWRTATFFDAQPDDKDLWFATNGVDDIQEWDGLTDQVTDLGATLSFTCKELFVFKNMLIYANILEDTGEVKPTSIKNSDAANPKDLAGGIAGEFIISDGVDPIVSLFSLGDNLVIYGQRSAILAQFVGTPLTFIFRTAIAGIGPISGRTVADFGDFHEFIGADSQFTFDGVTLKESGTHIWREVLRTKAPNRLELAFSHFDEENGDLIWAFPLTTDPNGPTEDTIRIAHAEHYLEVVGDRDPTPYSKRDFPFTVSGFFERQTTLTWDQISTAWSAQNFRWNDQFFTAAFPFNLVGDESGNVFTLNTSQDAAGAALMARARFGRVAISDGRGRNLVTRVYPFTVQFPGATYTLDVKTFLAESASGPAALLATDNFDLTLAGDRFVTPYRRGRYMEVEFGTAGPNEPWELEGYDFDARGGGRRG